MAKAGRKESGGRASAEAIEKRRVARQLNALLTGGGSGGLDGRTEKRRQRLLKELREGKRGQPLKPIEIVTHADELLALGETLTSLRKNGVKTPKLEAAPAEQMLETVKRAQSAYGFAPEVWRLLGIDLELLDADKRGSRAAKKPKRPG